MIFTRTCESTRKIALTLRNLGFGAIPIHGQMSQPKRLGALNKFKVTRRASFGGESVLRSYVIGRDWMDERVLLGGSRGTCRSLAAFELMVYACCNNVACFSCNSASPSALAKVMDTRS